MTPRFSIVVVIGALALAGCKNGPPDTAQYFTTVDFFVDDTNTRTEFVADLADADERVEAAFSRLQDTEIANAIVAADERGAEVRIVGDVDARDDAGFQILLDADVDVVFGDGTLRYLPDPTLAPLVGHCAEVEDRVVCIDDQLDFPQGAREIEPGAIERPGSFNLMSHDFVILETRTVWNFMGPFSDQESYPGAMRAESERMREVFVREFQQMHGGVFATTLDVYNGPVKSGVQNNPEFHSNSYLTDRGELQLAFNPQQRLTKSVIDETYRSRVSVWMMTDNLDEEFLIDALKYKHDAEFDVRVIVNEDEQSELTRAEVADLDFVRWAPADIDYVPTVALYDVAGEDRLGNLRPRRVQIVSHPMWRTGPFRVFTEDPSDRVEVYPADFFVDGSMWSLVEYRGQLHEVPEIDAFVDFFERVWSSSRQP